MKNIKSKLGGGDFLVLIFVGLIMIFVILLMNVLVDWGSRDGEVPMTFSNHYTKEIVKFLRAPANIISEEYNTINLGEYIHMYFYDDSFDSKFNIHTEEFLRDLCSYYHEPNKRCQIEIKGMSCIANTGRNVVIRGREYTIEVEDCIKRFPSRYFSTLVTKQDFFAPNGDLYEVSLRVD